MKAKRKIRGVFFRAGVAYICYQDARGSIVRESTRQNSITVAAAILAKRNLRNQIATVAVIALRPVHKSITGAHQLVKP